jgi:hypothetical protein
MWDRPRTCKTLCCKRFVHLQVQLKFTSTISSVQGRFCVDSNSEKSNPIFPSGRPSKVSTRSSVSNICLDDVAIPSGVPSMSWRFKQFKFAYVWMSWQRVRTLFRVPEESYVQMHQSKWCGNTVRAPASVRQVKRFPSQCIWEDSCNHPDDMVIPSACYPC